MKALWFFFHHYIKKQLLSTDQQGAYRCTTLVLFKGQELCTCVINCYNASLKIFSTLEHCGRLWPHHPHRFKKDTNARIHILLINTCQTFVTGLPSRGICSKFASSKPSTMPFVPSSSLLATISSCKGTLKHTECAVDVFVSMLPALSGKCDFLESVGERIVTCSRKVWCNPLTSCCNLLSVFCRALSNELREVCRILSSLSFSHRTLFAPCFKLNSLKFTFPCVAIFMLSISCKLFPPWIKKGSLTICSQPSIYFNLSP